MIKTEELTIGGKAFIRTYSDSNCYVVRDGISYEEAIDPAEFNRIYTEGDIIKNDSDNEENEDAQEILDILLGDDE